MGQPWAGDPEICSRVKRVPEVDGSTLDSARGKARLGEGLSRALCVRASAGAGGPVFALWLALFISLAIFSF